MEPATPTDPAPMETADHPSGRAWVRWVWRVGLLVASGAFAYWLVFTLAWLRNYLPHGGGG